jgi:hypothetical protein
MQQVVKIIVFCVVFLLTGNIALPQQPVFKEDFEQSGAMSRVKGINGWALDLGPMARVRQALLRPVTIANNENGFAVTVWVKGDPDAHEAYDILSSLHKTGTGYDGWKIGMTNRGSWLFTVRAGKYAYDYTTTAPRQTIQDGNWHQLAVSYSKQADELRFYYDGKEMAIYRADGIQGFYTGDTLVIGGSKDSEHYFERATWETFWDSFNGQIDDVSLYDAPLSAAGVAAAYTSATGVKPVTDVPGMPGIFKTTGFNIWHGAHEFGKEAGKYRLIDMLRKSNSDAFFLVETYGSGPEIADALGYYLYLISSNLSIISRYPITDTYPLTESFKSGGAKVQLPGGQKLNLFCIWLDWQPAFHSRGFTNGESWSLERYMEEERKRRSKDIAVILKDIQPYMQSMDSVPVIVAGDFNSGSHLDWTEHTRQIHKGYVIPWPASTAMIKAGFKDSYRELYPDALKYPGETFSDHYKMFLKARIDFIYYQGKKLSAVQSEIIDSHPVLFPSDHAAVSTLFRVTQ